MAPSILKTLKESFTAVYNRPRYLLLSSFSDLLFLFLYGFITAPFVKKIVENMLLVSSNISGSSNVIAARNSVLLILLFLAGYIIITYWLYIFFHGISWWCAHKVASDKSPWSLGQLNDFLKKFAITNLLWYSFFVILNLVSYSSTVFIMLTEKTKNVPKNYFILALFALIFYFAFNSYALLGKLKAKEAIKKSFLFGIKKVHYTLPVYAVIILFLLAFGWIVRFLFMLKLLAVGFILGIVLVFPLFFFLRLFLIKNFSNFNKI